MIQQAIERVAKSKKIDRSWFYGVSFRPTTGRGVMRAYRRIRRQQVFMRTVLLLFFFLVAFLFAYAHVEKELVFEREQLVERSVVDVR